MRLHELQPAKGSRKNRKRVGRGIAAGQGKTSGRGQKGQGSRSSDGLPVGFEGGQMRLMQRLPKLRGFHNKFRVDYTTVNLSKLNQFEAGSTVDPDTLIAAGLLTRRSPGVKVLGAGQLKVKLTLRVHRISETARTAIEKLGGSVELLEDVRETLDEKHKRKADKYAERHGVKRGVTKNEVAPAAGKAEGTETTE